MGHRTAREGFRVLVVAPYGRDAMSVGQLMTRAGYAMKACRDLGEVAASLDDEVGVVLLAAEALRADDGALRTALAAQPPWSDTPFVVLAAARTGPNKSTRARPPLPDFLTHAVVLDRPLGSESLLSAIASAMRSRQKQFQMRDRLIDLDRAKDQLASSEARLRLATEAAEIGFWDVDPLADTLFWPPLVKRMFGISADVPVSMTDFYDGLHPDDREAVGAAFAAAADPDRRALYDVEYRTVGKEDHLLRWVAAKGRGIFDARGVCTRLIGTAIDVTDRKTAEIELRTLNETLEQRVTERTGRLMQAEEALHQAQKMEAVGQLTGGIAHDFNNMLTGVIGALDIMRRRIAKQSYDDLDRFMDAATQSAQRAAGLTSRLLAFSRRQSLDSKPIVVNDLIHSLQDLLQRTMTERIRVSIALAENLPTAIADANQLESAILNLSINARDAMPDGGVLTIETGAIALDENYCRMRPEITPGRYVTIAVSDSGVGIDDTIMKKVFDPFFTTKPVGQGTGLGLSMVYGFAKQSKGQVRIHSVLGEGTSVKIYLPAGDVSVVHDDLGTKPPPLGKGQRVLMVEDDPSVRILVREVLEELGYEAIEAADAAEAIRILARDRDLDLMITDVGLPGMNGRQLAETARQHHSDLPILFVTGYAENAAIRAGFLGTNMDMITKPFQIDALATKVSEMIAGQGRGGLES